MDAFSLIILAAALLVSLGVLIGCTVSQWLFDARDRRQAAVQRSLNEQWKELGAARQEMLNEEARLGN